MAEEDKARVEREIAEEERNEKLVAGLMQFKKKDDAIKQQRRQGKIKEKVCNLTH